MSAQHPDRAWLRATLAEVLRRASRLLERFSELTDHWPSDRAEGHHDKLMGETAVLLLAATRVAEPALSADVAALAKALDRHVGAVRSHAMLLRGGRNRIGVLLPHLALRAAGREDAALAARLAACPPVPEGEALPFRRAEVAWIEALATGQPPQIDPFAPGAILSQPLNLLELDRIDLYAVTHWVIYATDLGRVAPMPRLRAAVAALIDDAIAWQVGAEDLDVLGELLLAARLVRLPPGNASAAGWALIRAAWERLEFLPSPGFSFAEADRCAEGSAREAYLAANSYHTVLVLGLLCAAELTVAPELAPVLPGVLPVALAAAAARARTAVARAAPFLDPAAVVRLATGPGEQTAEPPFWQQVLAPLPEATRMVCAAELIGAVRAYDLPRIARALDGWLRAGLGPEPLFLSALGYVARQQVGEGAIGGHFLLDENRTGEPARSITTVLADLLARGAALCEATAPSISAAA